MNVRRWLPPLAWAGVILFVTSVPHAKSPLDSPGFDKLVHLVLYAVFGVLLSRQIAQVTTPWRAAFIAIAVGVGFGAADELHQRFVPGRTSEMADWRADSAGAAVGAVLYALLKRRSRTSAQA